jgi:hypothetical protein
MFLSYIRTVEAVFGNITILLLSLCIKLYNSSIVKIAITIVKLYTI